MMITHKYKVRETTGMYFGLPRTSLQYSRASNREPERPDIAQGDQILVETKYQKTISGRCGCYLSALGNVRLPLGSAAML